MTRILVCELIAFVFYFLHCSFFEWVFHRYLFHSPKFLKITFHAHTIVHHQVYKYEPESYSWRDHDHVDKKKEHIAMAWVALPLFLAVHLPYFLIIERLTHLPSLWGGLAAVTAYYTTYEYFHYCMHIPSNRWFENSPVFRFVKEHHRIHHKYMLQNLNVFFPLADLCLGTFRSAASVGQPRVKPAVKETAPVTPSVTAAETVRAMTRKQAVAED
jgi:hypothetical protein